MLAIQIAVASRNPSIANLNLMLRINSRMLAEAESQLNEHLNLDSLAARGEADQSMHMSTRKGDIRIKGR